MSLYARRMSTTLIYTLNHEVYLAHVSAHGNRLGLVLRDTYMPAEELYYTIVMILFSGCSNGQETIASCLKWYEIT